jgi:hypothetical protein
MATKQVYSFKNGANSTLQDFLDVAIDTGHSPKTTSKFIERINEYAKLTSSAESGHIRTGESLLTMPMTEFVQNHIEEFSDVMFKLYDDPLGSQIAIDKGKPQSGIGTTLGKIKTVVNEFNKKLTGADKNAEISSKVISELQDKHTNGKDVKRVMGVLDVDAVRSNAVTFDKQLENLDRLMELELKTIRDIEGNVPKADRTLKQLQRLAQSYTKLAQLEAGRDLSIVLMSTGFRISEALSISVYDKSQSQDYNLAKGTFAKRPDLDGVNKYTVYLPPKVMKMTNGVNVSVGETIGKLLESRAVDALERGDTTQLFSYPIYGYDAVTNDIILKESSKAYDYTKYKNASSLPRAMFHPTFGALNSVPLLDANGSLSYYDVGDTLPQGKQVGDLKTIAISYNESSQTVDDFLTAHDYRRTFDTYATEYIDEFLDVDNEKFVDYFTGRISSVVGKRRAADYYIAKPHKVNNKMETFHEGYVKDLLKQINSKRLDTVIEKAKTTKPLPQEKAAYDNVRKNTNYKKQIEDPIPTEQKIAQKTPDTDLDIDNPNFPKEIDDLDIEDQRKYMRALETLDETATDSKEYKDAIYIRNKLEEQARELAQSKGKKVSKTKLATGVGVATAGVLGAGKAISATLPVLGAATGTYFAGEALAKDTSQFADEDDSELMAKAKQIGRAGTELVSGFSPVPTDLSILNLAPESIRGDNQFRTAGEILFPTVEERKRFKDREERDEVLEAEVDEAQSRERENLMDQQMKLLELYN